MRVLILAVLAGSALPPLAVWGWLRLRAANRRLNQLLDQENQ